MSVGHSATAQPGVAAFGWKSAARIAWRESRSSGVKFAFVILAVAVGVGSLTGVRGFASAFRAMLSKEARTLMAADVTARVFAMPTPEQQRLLDDLQRQGVRETQITETLTMAGPTNGAAPMLVSAKAVDPRVYPFYGELVLDPPLPLAAALTPDTVAVSPDLMLRLNIKAGDTVRLGGQDYRVIGAVAKEPDRMSGTINIGPRLLLSREALERTGLLNQGSRAAQKFLFQLPPATQPNAPTVDAVRERLKKAFPEAQVIDYRETHPIITRGLNRSAMFLSLVSLIALIVGALGVATAMHSHLQQKLDSIAVMKCLGARSHQITRIYLLQTMTLGLCGGLAGIALGAGVQLLFPKLIARYFQIEPAFQWDFAAIAQGLIAAVLATLLFTLPPLLSIRRIRPVLILRREMADARTGRRWPWESLATAAAIIVGISLLAAWIAGGKLPDAIRLGAYFAGGITFALAALAGVAWLLLKILRWVTRVRAIPAHIRHGLANLYRPGNQARPVLVALGLGVMFTATIYFVQKSMLEEITANAPPGMPNVFLLDIQPAQRDGVEAILRAHPGRENEFEIAPSVATRLVKVKGTAVEQLDLKGFGRRFLQTRTATWSAQQPKQTKILEGVWWPNAVAGLVSISEDGARLLKVKPGDDLEFTSNGRTFLARVAAVHRAESIRPGAANDFIFTPETLAGLPAIYFGGMRVAASTVPDLQRKLYAAFPTVTVINVADVIQTIQEVVDQIALVVRFISAFAILAGVIILASSVAGTRFRRVREVVILKTLGGTRQRISRIFSAEFSILGATAGVMGSLLAVGFANLILIRFFEGEFRVEPIPVLVAIVGSALVANLAGWLASARILGQKPLEVLRSE